MRTNRYTKIGGVPIRNTTTRALVRLIDKKASGTSPLSIAFVNHNFIVACKGLKLAVGDMQQTILVNDGVAIDFASWLLTGSVFKENLNGSDFIPRLLEDLKRPTSIFLLGSTLDVNKLASALIDKMPRRNVVGSIDGFSMWKDPQSVPDYINATRPDILLVGLGNPKQEDWILKNRNQLRVGVIIAVGAFFEWMTGYHKRAPLQIRRIRLEWLYRLSIEPRRLARRYTVNALVFAFIVWNERDLADGSLWSKRYGIKRNYLLRDLFLIDLPRRRNRLKRGLIELNTDVRKQRDI